MMIPPFDDTPVPRIRQTPVGIVPRRRPNMRAVSDAFWTMRPSRLFLSCFPEPILLKWKSKERGYNHKLIKRRIAMKTDALRKNALFRGFTEEETNQANTLLQAQTRTYRKGERILRAGDTTDRMGLVLSGSVTVESNDFWGNRTILSHVGAGGFFAETYALLENEVLSVDVTAVEKSEILFLRIGGLPALQPSGCPWIAKLAVNLLIISAQKNLTLSRRSFHTAPKTIRGRVLSYLNFFALQTRRTSFSIPFDRQQLADYLNVERTALSKELGKMQRDGLIRYGKNRFTILETGEAP